ncbi:hypothetical protein ABTI69_21560, partial [Acinetobacter baumannii]
CCRRCRVTRATALTETPYTVSTERGADDGDQAHHGGGRFAHRTPCSERLPDPLGLRGHHRRDRRTGHREGLGRKARPHPNGRG